MSAVKNTMEVINGANQSINNYYDMSLDNLNDIYHNSNNAFEMIRRNDTQCFQIRLCAGCKGDKSVHKETAKGSIDNGNNGRNGLAY